MHFCDNFIMDFKLEQRANIQFCVKFSKLGKETLKMLWSTTVEMNCIVDKIIRSS